MDWISGSQQGSIQQDQSSSPIFRENSRASRTASGSRHCVFLIPRRFSLRREAETLHTAVCCSAQPRRRASVPAGSGS